MRVCLILLPALHQKTLRFTKRQDLLDGFCVRFHLSFLKQQRQTPEKAIPPAFMQRNDEGSSRELLLYYPCAL